MDLCEFAAQHRLMQRATHMASHAAILCTIPMEIHPMTATKLPPHKTELIQSSFLIQRALATDPEPGKVTLIRNGVELDPAVYDDWVQAGIGLKFFATHEANVGHFQTWMAWSRQSPFIRHTEMSVGALAGVWGSLAMPDSPFPLERAPRKQFGTEQPRGLGEPELMASPNNAVGLIIDRHTEVRCGQVYITDVAELQRDFVALLEAVKGPR